MEQLWRNWIYCRSQAEEEKDRVQVKLAREQTTAAELQANFEAERNGTLLSVVYQLHWTFCCLHCRADEKA